MDYFLLLGFIVAFAAAEEPELTTADTSAVCNCSHLLNAEESTEVYPTFPTTSFTCWDRYDGYYADIEVDCTIFHYCQTWQFPTGLNETVKWDFACPQSTIFNQKILSCTPPNNSFDCQESPNYYWVNYINVTSTTSYSTANPETTPGSNLGQQLIIGGVGPQSVEYQESSESSAVPTEINPAPQSDDIHNNADSPSFPVNDESSTQSEGKQPSESTFFPSDSESGSGSSSLTDGHQTKSIYFPPSTPPSFFESASSGYESASSGYESVGSDLDNSLTFSKDPELVIQFPQSTPSYLEAVDLSKSHSDSAPTSFDSATADNSHVESFSYTKVSAEHFDSNLYSSPPSKTESEKEAVDFPQENFVTA